MNIRLQNTNPMSAGLNNLFGGGMLKSTAQKLERQARRDRQVDFFENQKKNLKNIECSSPEEAARILEMLHTYEDSIAAARAEYNNAQMFHLLDEAKEQGEENAKAIEKSEPKTAEERKKEAVEEALGIDEGKGILSEILDKVTEETLEAALDEFAETETALEQEASLGQEPTQVSELPAEELLHSQPEETVPRQPVVYKRFDALA
ncbi:hypothetical protein [Acetatifactor aquisgranensis]|jgi:hypothetical protein|uniref:hypothetical protein n=1 Tax=Acetatifactor aquisgranensis TaxID=2941233 RepID=UPI00203DF986|nr:hypothetical protein [Acetatifactor aquisgranensis]